MAARPKISLSTDIERRDFEAVARLKLLAFQEDTIWSAIFPPAQAPPLEERIALLVAEKTARYAKPQADMLEVKAMIPSDPADPSSPPRIVGFATWNTPVDRTTTKDEPHKDEPAQGKQPWEVEMDATKDHAFYAKFDVEMERVRNNWSQGRPHWYLSSLCVHPDYQGLGIGGALLKHGMDLADVDGLPVWLESTVAGLPVYQAKVFVVRDWCEVDGDQWTGGKLRWPGMERVPTSKQVPS